MLLSLIQNRRSIRKFSDQPVEKEKLEMILEGALRAPSSRGFNPWEFIVITNQEQLERLSQSKPHGSSFLKGAPLGIAILCDAQVSDVWIEDASIAATYLKLVAESLGLSSCWIQIRERMHNETVTAEAYAKNILGIPKNFKLETIIAIGYADEVKTPHPKNALQLKKVSLNQYGESYF